MSNITRRGPGGVLRWGWGILVTLAALLVLNSLFVFLAIGGSPEVQVAAILEFGLALMALIGAWQGFRHGSRGPWYALWALVIALACLGLFFLIGGELVIAVWYLFLASGALLGQLLVRQGWRTRSGEAGPAGPAWRKPTGLKEKS